MNPIKKEKKIYLFKYQCWYGGNKYLSKDEIKNHNKTKLQESWYKISLSWRLKKIPVQVDSFFETF